MPEYFKCSARISRITINTRNIFYSPEKADYNRPIWHASAAAFLIPTRDYGHCVILVKRSENTGNGGKWACLPAGGADNEDELRNPLLTLHREGAEELLIEWGGLPLNPFALGVPFPVDPVEIFDEGTGKSTIIQGEIYQSRAGQFIFMKAYQLEIPIHPDSDVIIKDGEEWVDSKTQEVTQLDRLVAVVPINKLDLRVAEGWLPALNIQPVAMFQSGKRIEDPPNISLHGYHTPTLEWLRYFVKRKKDLLRWGGLRG